MEWLLGSIVLVLAVVLAWQLWTNRASALPSALTTLAEVRSANTVLQKNVEQATLDKQVLIKEVDAQKLRADQAEAKLHDLEARTLDLLHGSDLLDEFNRMRRPLPDAGAAPAATGDGDAAPEGVQRERAVVDPWASDRG